MGRLWYNGAMASNPTLNAAAREARTHVNAAIDALLKPFRGVDGNCRNPNPNDPAEMAAWDAYRALAKLTKDTPEDRGTISRLERLTW